MKPQDVNSNFLLCLKKKPVYILVDCLSSEIVIQITLRWIILNYISECLTNN